MHKLLSGFLLLVIAGFNAQAFADEHKQVICHRGEDLTVAAPAVPAHMAHGDSMGSCDEIDLPDTRTAVVMMRCEGMTGDDPTVQIVSASNSAGFDIVPGLDCAVTLSRLLNTGHTIRSITSGSAGSDGDTHLYVDYLLLGWEVVE